MTPRPIPDEDTRLAAMRLADLIQTLALDRPVVLHAVERCVRALVAEERRQTITERLEALGPEDLATVDALLTQLEDNHEGDARSSL